MRPVFLALILGGWLGVLAHGADESKPSPQPNRLARESSPYLLQHAHNPVDWYPWGPEAFARAEKENKLVFLSIGYSSCHWCHVMERESFAHPSVAKILNKHFVCIKVDREERPDIDQVYMTALNVLGQRGGWPLSMFLLPDGRPILGGTYWPREDRELQGQPISGFKTILNAMQQLWQEDAERLTTQAANVAEATQKTLAKSAPPLKLKQLNLEVLSEAVRAYLPRLDPVHGGIGNPEREFAGTKFPMPATLEFLLQQVRLGEQPQLKKRLDTTLLAMARGGIFDHLGGGFHRYSTERTWTVPHFEKMLYDNAQLVELYANAYQAEPKPRYRRVIQDTFAFVARELTSPQGAFYSALDADSEEEEGAFYVWTREQIEKILGNVQQRAVFQAVYGGIGEPNFEGGRYILKQLQPVSRAAEQQQLSQEHAAELLADARAKLLAARASRPRPFRDTKILTAWNGQMIAGYARAGQVLDKPAYIAAACKAAEFVLEHLRDANGRLKRVATIDEDGSVKVRLNAYLDDYAFLVHGLLNLHEATGDERWLEEAKSLTDVMVQQHYDGSGGYYFTSHDHEKLFARAKETYDGAQPSGNGVATSNLVRLSRKTGDVKYRGLAGASFAEFASLLQETPRSVPTLLRAYQAFVRLAAAPAAVNTATPAQNAQPASQGGIPKSNTVVKLLAKASKRQAKRRTVTLTLTIKKPWHIYANPVKNRILDGADTKVTIRQGDKTVDAKIVYPKKPKKIADKTVGDYFVYEGNVVIIAEVKDVDANQALKVEVQLQACNDNTCLLPAKLTAEVP